MATEILDKLIQSQWGKSLIMWFFMGMAVLVASLLWALFFLTKEIKEVNDARARDRVEHNIEINTMSKAHIAELQSFINRLSEVEKKRKK